MTEAAAVIDGAAAAGRTVYVTTRTGRPLKHRVRSCLDRVAKSSGLLGWCERGMRQGLTILMYHRVLPAEQCAAYPLQALVMPAEVFESQVRWLAANCRVLPVREALAQLATGGPFERPLVSLTFDDGYDDNANLAQPILEHNGVRGTFYITTGFIDTAEPLWFDRATSAWAHLPTGDRSALLTQVLSRLNEHDRMIASSASSGAIATWMEALKRAAPADRAATIQLAEDSAAGEMEREAYEPMSIDQLRSLHRSGHEIASHTVTHPILPQLGDDDLRHELERSREQLITWIDGEVTGFCYPNGDTDIRVERAVQAAGYTHACTTASGINRPGEPQLRLARLSITMDRTMDRAGAPDDVAFRAEVSRLRQWWRSR